MKVLCYCQHVLGIGHLHRTLAIIRALDEHEVTLVLGGPPAPVKVPGHVQVVHLPGLQMDPEFSAIKPVQKGADLESIKKERSTTLSALFEALRPDILLIELYPFGRGGFRFELTPLLKKAKNNTHCKIVCSLRDILVEKKDQNRYENKVLSRLNPFFDALLIHGDPSFIPLQETFAKCSAITVKTVYTGYICSMADSGARQRIRDRINMKEKERLIVVSAGSGSVGHRLLESTTSVFHDLPSNVRMQVFTGPYLDEKQYKKLQEKMTDRLHVRRFSEHFPAWLAGADLSISMGGYNTSMNVVAEGVPALILPFAQNREQRMRAEKLSRLTDTIGLLADADLYPQNMVARIMKMLEKKRKVPDLRLDGAAFSADWLERFANGEA